MEHIAARGDTLQIWWPNGAGYDILKIIECDEEYQLELIAQYEVCADGQYRKCPQVG